MIRPRIDALVELVENWSLPLSLFAAFVVLPLYAVLVRGASWWVAAVLVLPLAWLGAMVWLGRGRA